MSGNLKKRVSVFLCILLVAFLALNSSNYTFAKEDLVLYAKAAVLMDAQTGRVLYDKNSSEIMPMASTTKIMTCIVALENGNLDDVVTVSTYAAGMPKVHLGMQSEDQFYLKDLLYSLMLESHNDSAVAIAEHLAGSVEGFARMMNEKAKDLGCNDTYFITPNGLDATKTITYKDGTSEVKTHSTTARDLARIMSYCIMESPQKETFLKITRTASHSFQNVKLKEDGSVTNGSKSYSCNNHNAFLSMMDGALSGKTGFTGNAGYCYVGALERDGRTFVVSLLACGWPNNKTYKWSDTKKLMGYGIDNYQFQSFDSIPIEESKLKPKSVKNGQTQKSGGRSSIEIKVVDGMLKTEGKGLLVNSEESIKNEYEIRDNIEAPVNKGDKIGTITYYVIDDQNQKSVWKIKNVLACNTVPRIDYLWCLKQVLNYYGI